MSKPVRLSKEARELLSRAVASLSPEDYCQDCIAELKLFIRNDLRLRVAPARKGARNAKG